jgi:hypothetical protein
VVYEAVFWRLTAHAHRKMRGVGEPDEAAAGETAYLGNTWVKTESCTVQFVELVGINRLDSPNFAQIQQILLVIFTGFSGSFSILDRYLNPVSATTTP